MERNKKTTIYRELMIKLSPALWVRKWIEPGEFILNQLKQNIATGDSEAKEGIMEEGESLSQIHLVVTLIHR